jgi:hypothetical protein
MKLSNIFKKENSTNAKAKVEKLDKNQLDKIIGGEGEIEILEDAALKESGGRHTPFHNKITE